MISPLQVSATSEGAETYGQMATQIIPEATDRLVAEIQVQVHPNVWPHEVKRLRKEVLAVRVYADFFVHAYPVYSGVDPWRVLRSGLDDLYGALGEFKDIYDSIPESRRPEQPTPYEYAPFFEEIQRLRLRMLAARDGFIQVWTPELKSYFRQSVAEVSYRPKLPRFFWGEQVGYYPASATPVKVVVGELGSRMISNALTDYEATFALDNLLEADQEEQFHDFRKLLRYLHGFWLQFDKFQDRQWFDGAGGPALDGIKAFVSAYGDLNDMLQTFHRAESPDERNQIRQVILSRWFELRDQQEEFRLAQHLATLQIWFDSLRGLGCGIGGDV